MSLGLVKWAVFCARDPLSTDVECKKEITLLTIASSCGFEC